MKNMYLPPEFQPRKRKILFREDYENSPGHAELTERLCKSLYYGRTPGKERPSLPMTEMCVECFQEASPRGLGKVESFYASSVGRRACISPCSMMLGMIYIDRLKKRNNEYLQTVSSSDLFLISMMVASKYLYDEGVDEEVFNDEWAESAKIDTEEVNQLEMNFLAAIDWSLFVKQSDFKEMLSNVEKRIALQQGIDRGWFSYMDLLVLSEDGQINRTIVAFINQVSKVVLVCTVAYIAGVVTMAMAPLSLAVFRSCVLPPQQLSVLSSPSQEQPADRLQVSHTVTQSLDHLSIPESSHDQNNQSDSGNVQPDSERSVRDGQTTRFSLPHFMTLAFIGETVNSFLGEILDRYKHKTRTDAGAAPGCRCRNGIPMCSPGNCETGIPSPGVSCRNFSSVEEYEDWCLSCLPWLSADPVDSLSRDRSGPGRIQERECCNLPAFAHVFPMCCCHKAALSWELPMSSSRPHKPFPDIALGFGTTVLPV